MESIVSKFFEEIPNEHISTNESADSSYLSGIKDSSCLFTGGIFVMDFQKRCLPVVSHRDIFLCGNTVEHAAQAGYNFFLETVHEEDIPLFIKIHRTILKSEYIIDKEQQSQIKYFYFTVRLKEHPQLYSKPSYLMICHKIKPVFINDKIRYGICLTTISRMLTPGNLRVYFNNNRKAEEYSFDINTWIKYDVEPLTSREIEILRLAKRGFKEHEIANQLCMTYGRLRHAMSELFKKLDVKTMEQAVTHASNHLMLFDAK
ncbi:MAG: helix-turn-helix transcriptional regulator [Dysgonamonadaceae bacterium]|jgi:DNA-binding CsgD family transcriptional regulator|nr:helix-turn-helix transcriptional regulator [Dysgonamonadaceae bacterium]